MTDLTTSTTHAHLRTTPTGPSPRGSAAKDNALCAAILAGAAIAWFGWGQAGHRLGTVLGIGSVLAALVTVAAAIGIGVIRLQVRRRRLASHRRRRGGLRGPGPRRAHPCRPWGRRVPGGVRVADGDAAMTRETPPATDLDPVIHVPVRLRLMVILTELPAGDTMSFARLQGLLELTPGNLITHLRKLEEAGYVETVKTGRVTTAHVTDGGRAAFTAYRRNLAALLGG